MLNYALIDFNDKHIHLLNDGETTYLNLTNMSKAVKLKDKTLNIWLATSEGKSLIKSPQSKVMDVKEGKYQDGLYAELPIAFNYAKWVHPDFESQIKREVENAIKSGALFKDGKKSRLDESIDKLLKHNPKKDK